MPWKSLSQMRGAHAGYLGPEMKRRAKTWDKHTKNIKDLPEHVEKKAYFWNGFIDELSKYADGLPGMAEQVSEAKMVPNLNKPSHVSADVISNSIPKSYKPHITPVKAVHHVTTPLVKYMGKSAGLITSAVKGIGGLAKSYGGAVMKAPLKTLGTTAAIGIPAYTVAKDTSNFMKTASLFPLFKKHKKDDDDDGDTIHFPHHMPEMKPIDPIKPFLPNNFHR